jgi:hypothetical protein
MATTSQVVTSQLPTAFEEFYKTGVAAKGTPGTPGYQPEIKGLIPQAFGLYGSGTPAGYQANIKGPLEAANLYTGAQRVQGLTPGQTQVGSELTGMRTPSQFGAGTAALQQGTQGLVGLLNQQAQTVSAPFLNQYQMYGPERIQTGQVTTGSFTAPGAAQQFMSPYMQNVVDVQKQEAIRGAQQGQLAQNLAAARQGTYGGARQLLAGTERERNLGQQLAQIQATGSQSAYDAAQRAFEAEQGRGLQAQQITGQFGLTAAQANQQAAQQAAQQNLQALLGVQQLGAGQSLEAQRANQAAALQAAQQRQQAALGLGTAGAQMGQLGVAQQAADIDRLKTLGAYGDYERAVLQQQKDIDYQNMMQRIQYPEEQLDKLSGFIRGIPMTDRTVQTTTPPPSFASQLTGLGIAGLGAFFGK